MVSTTVALHFLSYLYQSFDHNWLLAIAAYNAGPGAVSAAIRYNKAHGRPTDFWSLPLPAQTRAYIPKLLALAEIIAHPSKYGFQLAPISNQSVTSTVTLEKQMPLTTIANMASTPLKTVKALNPAFKTWETPPNQSVKIVLPVDKESVFKKHLATQKIPNKNSHNYTVKSGDCLSLLASHFHVTPRYIMHINHLTSTTLHPGQQLIMPT